MAPGLRNRGLNMNVGVGLEGVADKVALYVRLHHGLCPVARKANKPFTDCMVR